MTKKHNITSLTFMSLALAANCGYAAVITWQPSVITSDETDVSLSGQTRLAINAVSATSTVNGVEFTQVTSPAVTSLAPSLNGGRETIACEITDAYGSFGSGSTTAPLSTLLPGAFWSQTSPALTTFSDLVPGQEYEIQIFCNDARNNRTDQFMSLFDNGLDPTDPAYVAIAGTAKLSNRDAEGVGVAQGDYIIGTFTADGTTQTFRMQGSTDGGTSGNSAGRIEINAIQLRATGDLLPIPDVNETLWTGLVDANLDNDTINFAINSPDAALSQGSLTTAVSNGADVVFADNYTSDPGGTVAVSQSLLTIPDGAMPTAPLLTFRNSSTTPYSITSADADGITGASTNVATEDPDAGVEGDGGTLTLYGTHSFGGNLTADFDTTVNVGDATTVASLTNAGLSANGTINWDTTTGDATFGGNVIGAGTFAKTGAGILTVSGSSAGFSGTTSITEGTLLANGNYTKSTVDIASGAIFEIDRGLGTGRMIIEGTYTGEGIFRFNNSLATNGFVQVRGTMALGPDAVIDVVTGTGWSGSGSFQANWTANQSNLTVAEGAVFNGVEASIRINALNGEGDVTTGWATGGYNDNGFTIGVANGSGTFNGDVNDSDTVNLHTGILRKVGTGTQVFGGNLMHQRNTIVQDGTFELSSTGSQTFFLGVGDSITGDGSTNRITGTTTATAAPTETGTGNAIIDGQFVFDYTSAATPFEEGDFWIIVDSSELASVTYEDNFAPSMLLNVTDEVTSEVTVLTFALVETAPGSGIWQSEEINNPLTDVPWVFSESIGTLSLGAPILPDFNEWANSFLPDDVSDPEVDFDGDSLTNEDEYLFGLDPTDPNSFNPITVPLDVATGTLSFTRRDPALTGVLSSVLTSTDLVTWTRDEGATLTPSDAVDDIETVLVEISAGLLTSPKLFVMIAQRNPILFSADFEESEDGFTLFGEPNQWAYGAPDSDNGQSGAEELIITTGNGGSVNCWGTNLTGGATSGVNSILRGPDATTAGIDLTAISNAELTFAAALDADTNDIVEVLVKEVGTDAVLVTLDSDDLGLSLPQTSDWSAYGPYDISGAAGKTVYLEFRYQADGTGYIGLYIDDIAVTETF